MLPSLNSFTDFFKKIKNFQKRCHNQLHRVHISKLAFPPWILWIKGTEIMIQKNKRMKMLIFKTNQQNSYPIFLKKNGKKTVFPRKSIFMLFVDFYGWIKNCLPTIITKENKQQKNIYSAKRKIDRYTFNQEQVLITVGPITNCDKSIFWIMEALCSVWWWRFFKRKGIWSRNFKIFKIIFHWKITKI